MARLCTIIVFCAATISCQTGELLNRVTGGYGRSFSVQLLNLYNQSYQSHEQFGELKWHGDWIFRRERLAAIDQTLASLKPELILIQGLLRRQESEFENDFNILKRNALNGYTSQITRGKEDRVTGEIDSLALVGTVPLLQPHFVHSQQ